MKKENFVAMGEYYRDSTSLVRTVCRAFDASTGAAIIVYTNIENNGFASDLYFMSEPAFKNSFLKAENV